jgi:uncharacterized protein
MSRTRLLPAALALSLAAGAAFAQQPAPAAPPAPAPAAQSMPSASHLQIARDVALASGITQSFDGILASFPERMRQTAVTRPELTKDLNEVLDAMKPELELQKQQMVNNAVLIYAQVMTEPELNEVAAFFKGPTGAKYLRSQPQIIERMVAAMQPWSQQVAEYVMVRVRAEMGKRGHQL